jgi:hypothetical protein
MNAYQVRLDENDESLLREDILPSIDIAAFKITYNKIHLHLQIYHLS